MKSFPRNNGRYFFTKYPQKILQYKTLQEINMYYVLYDTHTTLKLNKFQILFFWLMNYIDAHK